MEPLTIKPEAPQLLNETLSPLAQSIGDTLRSIWSISFGWIDMASERINARRLAQVNSFKDKLEKEVAKIQPENLIEPPLSVIGPAIEASKYYFESESLRDMFANLIANSMNRKAQHYVQNCFVEIIKNMSPIDAINMKRCKVNGNYPIVQFQRMFSEKGGHRIIYRLFFFWEDQEAKRFAENAISLSNLQRLGLIDIKFDAWLTDNSQYSRYIDCPYSQYELAKSEEAQDSPITSPYHMQRGIFSLTPLGNEFIYACL